MVIKMPVNKWGIRIKSGLKQTDAALHPFHKLKYRGIRAKRGLGKQLVNI